MNDKKGKCDIRLLNEKRQKWLSGSLKLKIRPHGRDNEWTGREKQNKTINAIVSAEQKNIEARTKEKEKQTNVGAKVSKRN